MSRLLLLVFLLLASCRHEENLTPKIQSSVQQNRLQSMPSSVENFSSSEKHTDWGKEYIIGRTLAKRLDLYSALTTLKRAEILAGEESPERQMELQYEVFFAYYLGARYQNALSYFEESDLKKAPKTFPPYKDILVILYDCYAKLGQKYQASAMLSHIASEYPDTASELALATALEKADLAYIKDWAEHDPQRPYLKTFLDNYQKQKKSSATAQRLNAILPGSGYLYLGQKQAAVTSFLLNALFIGAAAYSFVEKNIAAGAIFTSLEIGWYFGGIHGAREQALLYNERLYEKLATPMMNQEKLFPIFQVKYAF